ncbi:protamine-like [Drosophila navojoa]|uniref:protamine-like n=1 Tax=Drosophila navojoa TaxID=7232 RepID=UPI0011BF3F18|nr:protamine-like [Drosophila navojoa]
MDEEEKMDVDIATGSGCEPEQLNHHDSRMKNFIHAAKIWNRMPFYQREAYRNIYDDAEHSPSCVMMDVSDYDSQDDYPMHDPNAGKAPRYAKCANKQSAKRKKPKKWIKPGPVTNNAYLNFVRTVRRKYCGLQPKQLVILAAYEWRNLSDSKKEKYRRQAYEISAIEREKRQSNYQKLRRTHYHH